MKVKRKNGHVVEYPTKNLKDILEVIGFSGGLLVRGTKEILREAKKFTKRGVITSINLEKAVVRGVNNTNRAVVDITKKIAKRVLK